MYKLTGAAEEIFRSRYAITEAETWEEACLRVSRQMALAEIPAKQKIYEEKFFEIIKDNLFVPGGRIWYSSGRLNPTLLNCFVLNPDKDSKIGWGRSAYDMIVTSMNQGGCGDDFSEVRPKGAEIKDQKGAAPGPLELMKLIDGCAPPIRSAGARRVALMFSLDLDHTDLLEFLDAKLIKGQLTYANISVRSKKTKEFIKAIKNDEMWELHWKGKYKKEVKAREIWKTIVTNAYNSAEPGFLNWELVESESNIYYTKALVTTNPCGELPLSAYESCDLGHLVLHRFVENKDINYSKLGDVIRLAVRYLDNVLTVNHYPLPEMKTVSHSLRRIGLGVTGLADCLMLLGLRYGSEEANKFIDKLFRFISKVAYESSIMLALEKGPFPLCQPNKFVESGYMKRMPNKIKSLIKEHGIRNCTLLTVAPTGTVSLLSGNCSSGIEPAFAAGFTRRFWEGNTRKAIKLLHPIFEQFMQQNKSVEHFVGAKELSIKDHLEVQKIVQKHIDSSVSKTVNLSENADIKEMEDLWLEYLPYLKGTTFYRENTRGYVDEKGNVHEPPLVAMSLDEAKKLFFEQHCVEAATVDNCPKGVCEL